MGLQGLVRWLLPREDHFYDFLERQAAVAHQAAQALAGHRDGKSATQVREEVQVLEHEGDKAVHEMEEALARTFVTPIDREDLMSLSAQLDDILDLTNGAARACVLFGVTKPTAPMLSLMELLIQATEVIVGAVPLLRKHEYAKIIEESRRVRQLEKAADQIYREAIRALFHDDGIDAKVLLREREVLEDLERAMDHSNRVAGLLINLSVKHG